MGNDCIFCKIANGEIKTDFVLENEDCVAFKDLNPQAPVHVLVIPKKHFSTLNDLQDADLLGKLMLSVQQSAETAGVKDNYRTVINTGKEAGQAVFHIHAHILGGRAMNWPPG